MIYVLTEYNEKGSGYVALVTNELQSYLKLV